jgi:ADP-ribose pyrophosphatase
MRRPKHLSTAPDLPIVKLELLEDQSPQAAPGFLRLVRRQLIAIDQKGQASAPFVYDEVDRLALDAAVIAAHYVNVAGSRQIFLRSAARPPVLLRASQRNAHVSYVRSNGLWELPAGLVEPDELSTEGIRHCAKRELEEELGFSVPLDALLPLGPSTFPCPGVIGERHYFFHVIVNPLDRKQPTLDGSAIERLGAVIDVSLADALDWCRQGSLEDAKTELGLRRLAELHID